jgi:hypothetical protein
MAVRLHAGTIVRLGLLNALSPPATRGARCLRALLCPRCRRARAPAPTRVGTEAAAALRWALSSPAPTLSPTDQAAVQAALAAAPRPTVVWGGGGGGDGGALDGVPVKMHAPASSAWEQIAPGRPLHAPMRAAGAHTVSSPGVQWHGGGGGAGVRGGPTGAVGNGMWLHNPLNDGGAARMAAWDAPMVEGGGEAVRARAPPPPPRAPAPVSPARHPAGLPGSEAAAQGKGPGAHMGMGARLARLQLGPQAGAGGSVRGDAPAGAGDGDGDGGGATVW